MIFHYQKHTVLNYWSLSCFRFCAVECTVPAVLSDCTGRRLADWACRTGLGCHTPPPPGKCPRCHSHQCGAHSNWLDKKKTVLLKFTFKFLILYYVRTFTMLSYKFCFLSIQVYSSGPLEVPYKMLVYCIYFSRIPYVCYFYY